MHVYEVHPRKDKRGIDLISHELPFGRMRDDTPGHAIGCAMHSSRSADAVIRVLRSLGVAESVAFSHKVPNLSIISFALPFSV
jgi:hypothetical protein